MDRRIRTILRSTPSGAEAMTYRQPSCSSNPCGDVTPSVWRAKLQATTLNLWMPTPAIIKPLKSATDSVHHRIEPAARSATDGQDRLHGEHPAPHLLPGGRGRRPHRP